MTTWDAVHAKRAVREFSSRPLAPEHLDRILAAGRRAHSAKNRQRWGFVVVQERAHLEELAKVGPYAGHVARASVAIALVTPDPVAPGAPPSIMWDLGGAAAQMMLVGWELGVGSCPATVYDHPLARDLLGYPEGMHCEFILSFGYPADPSVLTAPNRSGGRRPLEEIVHQERWGGA